MRSFLIALCLVATAALGGCASGGIQKWESGGVIAGQGLAQNSGTVVATVNTPGGLQVDAASLDVNRNQKITVVNAHTGGFGIVQNTHDTTCYFVNNKDPSTLPVGCDGASGSSLLGSLFSGAFSGAFARPSNNNVTAYGGDAAAYSSSSSKSSSSSSAKVTVNNNGGKPGGKPGGGPGCSGGSGCPGGGH